MSAPSLADMARALIAGNRGLLAMGESNPICNARFAALGIRQSEDARRAYRTFSLACAIQQPARQIWERQQARVGTTHRALSQRARCNSAARRGEYKAAMGGARA